MDHHLGDDPLYAAPSKTSTLWFSVKVASFVILILFGYAAVLRAWHSFLRHQEKTYRLGMRRKYGIPDTDHRPFNVAHAAVLRARQEREAQERARRVALPTQQIIDDAEPSRNQAPEAERNVMPGWLDRSPSRPPNSAVPSPPSPFGHQPPKYAPSFVDRYNYGSPVARLSDPLVFPRSTQRLNRKHLVPAHADESLSDGDEDMQVDHHGVSMDDADSDVQGPNEKLTGRHRRGAKRLYGDDEDEVAESKRSRGKRPRKVSKEHRPEANTPMMMVDEDGDRIAPLRSVSRGKKRDRAEAGSTFGADDEDSVTGTESEDGSKARQRRKRRTVSKRKSEVHARGKKRDRETDWHDVDGEDSDGHKSRTKREKRYSEDEGYQGSDTSLNGSRLSRDPLCKGRRIGDEWESNGIQYKVGSNGERLRQALVKKARSKFVMPKDSQHPDRQAHMEVYVETWLTEDQYNEAKNRHELAWQDSPKVVVESKPSDDVVTPVKEGKDLLWSTRDGSSKSRPFRQSIATTVGLHANPFRQSLAGPGRRVTSAFIGEFGSPRVAQRTFSKWEKQDLEAEAMARLRERKRNEEPTKPGVAALPTPSITAIMSTPTPFVKAGDEQTLPVEGKSTAISFGVSHVNTQLPSKPTKAMESSASTAPAPPPIPTFQLTPPAPPTPQAATVSPSLLGVPSFNPPKSSIASSNASALPPASTTQAPPPPQKPILSFGVATSNSLPAPTAPNFLFGVSPSNTAPAGSSHVDSQKKAEQPTGSVKATASLMDRVGGFAPPAGSDATATSLNAPLTFGKPITSSASASDKVVPAFGASNTTAKGVTTGAPGAGGGVKFNFGFGNKPTTTPAFSAPSAQPSVTGAASQVNSPSKPADITTPKFTFGGATFGSGSGTQETATTTVQPTFGGFGASSSLSAAAPTTSSTPAAPTATTNIFGGAAWNPPASAASGFGFPTANTTKPKSAEPKPAFTFAPLVGVGNSGTMKSNTTFSNPSGTTSTVQKKPESQFIFGSSNSGTPPTSTFGTQAAKDASGSVFGKSGMTTSSMFGSKDTEQTVFGGSTVVAQPEQTTPAKPTSAFGAQSTTPFAFGVASSNNNVFGNPQPANAADTTTAVKPTATTFGFGASSGGAVFSFGTPPTGSTGQQ